MMKRIGRMMRLAEALGYDYRQAWLGVPIFVGRCKVYPVYVGCHRIGWA